MDKNSESYRSREDDDFFDAAEIENLAEEDFVAYNPLNRRMHLTVFTLTYSSDFLQNNYSIVIILQRLQHNNTAAVTHF